MLKKILITLLLTCAMSIASAGKMTLLEEAAEFDALNVRISASGKGTVRLRPCDQCDKARLKIGPSTTLTVGGKTLPLSALNNITLHDGTLFFRMSDGVVTRIEATR